MPYTADQFKNSATSRLIGGASGGGFSLLPTDTVFTIVGGSGANFSSTTPFMLAAGNLAGTYELMQCTNRNGDVFTVVRGQEGTLPQTWPVNTLITQVVTAGSLNDLWTAINSGRVVNVKDYGAKGDGLTDDTAAIQAAITAVQNQTNGGQVYFPASTYNVSAPLLVTADNVMLLGESWASRLQAVGSSWVSGSYFVQMVPAPSGLRSGVRVSNLYLDGGNIAGLRGIQFATPTRSMLDRTRVSNFAGGYAVHWGETSSGYGFGNYNVMLGCHLSNPFGNATVGVRTDNADRLLVTDNVITGFQNNSNGYGIQCTNWNSQFINNQIVSVDVGIDISFASHVQIANNQFDNINLNAVRLRGSHECVVNSNYIGASTTTNQAAIFVSNANNYGNVVSNNTVQSGSGWQYFVQETAGISGGSNLYQNNQPGGITSVYLTGRNANGVFSAKEFGAVGDGVNDDAPAILAALMSANSAGGGTVVLPPGTFLVKSPLEMAGNNVALVGTGAVAGNTNSPVLGATVIKAALSATWDVIRTPLPPSVGSAGYVYYGTTVKDLTIDCGSMAGTVSGQGNGVHFYGVRYGLIENVDVFSCPNWAFLLDGDVTNFSYNNLLRNCIAGLCAAGIRFTNSEQGTVDACIIEGASLTTTAAQPYGSGSPTTYANHLYCNTGWVMVRGCNFGTSGSYTQECVLVDNAEASTFVNNLWDTPHGTALKVGGGGHVVMTGNIISHPGHTTAAPAIALNTGGNVISGNRIEFADANMTYSVQEFGAQVGNIITNNQLMAGTSGTLGLNSASTARVAGNQGYNPVGLLSAPVLPTSGSAQLNMFGVDATVYLTGSSIASVLLGNASTGMVTGQFRVPSAQTITVNYTGTPLWRWFGD